MEAAEEDLLLFATTTIFLLKLRNVLYSVEAEMQRFYEARGLYTWREEKKFRARVSEILREMVLSFSHFEFSIFFCFFELVENKLIYRLWIFR